jgi:hypothetical protein
MIYVNILLGALTIGGGSARPRGGGRGSQRSQIRLPCPLGIYKNGQFPTLTDLKDAKNILFYLKVLNNYTPKTFYEEYINFKIFCNLRRYGVIPVQNFGSHIYPQSPGLGLTLSLTTFFVSLVSLHYVK